ncbi:UNVERIFIED_CONTAM: hypothetical protein Sradi_2064000 [Sesamum radiatum]|uniref:Uncharacterized protein n=1 Tax=Sesamum radiatum TaxID=300843 RepID=A0AAW2TI22_SESRA
MGNGRARLAEIADLQARLVTCKPASMWSATSLPTRQRAKRPRDLQISEQVVSDLATSKTASQAASQPTS